MNNNVRFYPMNYDTLSYIISFCNLCDIKNISLVSKEFDKIISSNKYVYFLSIDNKYKLLIKASQYNKINIFNLLLNDCCIDPFTYQYNKAMSIACNYGNEEIVKLLLKDNRIYFDFNMDCFVESIGYSNQIKIYELLLESDHINLNNCRWSIPSICCFLLYYASIKNQKEIVKLLIYICNKFSPGYENNDDDNILGELLKFGYNDIFKMLIKDGPINPLYSNSYIFEYSITTNNMEILKSLIEDGRAIPSINNNEALKCAYKLGRKQAIELLLKDDRVNQSHSPIFKARKCCLEELIKIYGKK